MKTTTKIIYPILAGCALAFLSLLPETHATDLGGVLANGNTADGSGVLTSITNGFGNSGFGFQALHGNTSGGENTAVGYQALVASTTINGQAGSSNTAAGYRALASNTVGNDNTAVGFQALVSSQNAIDNTAIGSDALANNTRGNYNTASGFQALNSNQIGGFNTAVGTSALLNNKNSYNTATGFSALAGNIGGTFNTANGYNALASANGSYNTATGAQALENNVGGARNTANGVAALFRNTTGGFNTATGNGALYSSNGNSNTADGLGALALSSGNNNIGLGAFAGVNLTTGDSNIDIGNEGVTGDADTIRIGTTGTHTLAYMAGIFNGVIIGDNMPVLVGSDGKLGTAVGSSRRFKTDIHPMDSISEGIFALKPVAFRYKSDKTNKPQFGLIAEDVAKVNPALTLRDKNGTTYSVRYDQVNAMLLNEFLKEHKRVEEQQATIAQLTSTVGQQQKSFMQQEAQIEALTSGLQKVSAQLEMSSHTSKIAAENR